MHRGITFIACLAVIMLGSALQAQAQFSIRAASDEAVQGWDKMEFGNRTVWVSPAIGLTSEDIARAQQSTDQDRRNVVEVFFTDRGAAKMRDLSAAQINKLIAVVLDGRVIFAPRIRSEIGKEAVITGNGPNGLNENVIQRILASINQK